MKSSATNLILRLTEPVVFLRGNPTGDPANKPRRQRHAVEIDPSPTLIRGLLILQLSKPSKVRSIGIKLKAVTRTEWPEGIGARGNEFFDEKVILEERVEFFNWQMDRPNRRHNCQEKDKRIGSVDSASTRKHSIDKVSRRGVSLASTNGRLSPRQEVSSSPDDTGAHNTTPSAESKQRRSRSNGLSESNGTPGSSDPIREGRTVGLGNAFASVRGAFSRSRSRAPVTTLNGPVRHASPVRAPRSVSRGRGTLADEVNPDESYVETRQGNYRTSPSPNPQSIRSASRGPRGMDNGPARSRSRGRDAAGKPLLNSAASVISEAVRGRSQAPSGRENPTIDESRSPSHGRGGHIEEADGKDWCLFQPGTYSYPIALAIPAGSPPSIMADFGSTVYTLTAKVVRAGALTANLTASTEVLVVCCPGDDDTEEVDSIIIERAWEDQMRYEIGLSGKAWPIGTSMPINFKITPMEKIQVHRITAALEEKKEFIAGGGKTKRQAPKEIFQLLKVGETSDQPILPSAEDGPGPWELHYDLRLPSCKSRINFSTIHPASAIRVQHTLRMTLRVSRGDDVHLDSKGRRKQFDIIIEALGTILSCRCTSMWTSLPAYETEEHLDHMNSYHRHPPAVGQTGVNTDGTQPTSESSIHEYSVTVHDLILSEEYAKLAAGQTDETGSAPPAYHEVAARADSPEPSRGRSTGVATPRDSRSESSASLRAVSPT